MPIRWEDWHLEHRLRHLRTRFSPATFHGKKSSSTRLKDYCGWHRQKDTREVLGRSLRSHQLDAKSWSKIEAHGGRFDKVAKDKVENKWEKNARLVLETKVQGGEIGQKGKRTNFKARIARSERSRHENKRKSHQRALWTKTVKNASTQNGQPITKFPA